MIRIFQFLILYCFIYHLRLVAHILCANLQLLLSVVVSLEINFIFDEIRYELKLQTTNRESGEVHFVQAINWVVTFFDLFDFDNEPDIKLIV